VDLFYYFQQTPSLRPCDFSCGLSKGHCSLSWQLEKIHVTAVTAVVAVKVGLSSMMWTEQTYCLEICRSLSVLIYINHFLTCQVVSIIL
jgi:hypothetical protein